MRTQRQIARDRAIGRDWELEIKAAIQNCLRDLSMSLSGPDFVVPGFAVDCKVKASPLARVWHVLDGVPEEHLFMANLAALRALAESPVPTWWCVKDCCRGGRILVPSARQVLLSPRAHVRKNGMDKVVLSMRDWPTVELVTDVMHLITREVTGR